MAGVIADNRAAKISDIRRGKELPFFDPAVIPSFHDIGCKCAHRRSMLATGEDLVASDALHRLPWVCASIYHPIAVKSVCLIESPTQFKGGMIVDLFKEKGSAAEDIMLASEPGKAIASVLRKKMIK